MSILNDEEFRLLRSYKNKMNLDIVERILSDIELDYERSKDLKLSTIYVYSNYVAYVRENKEFFDLVLKILQKYSQKIGIENVIQLILSSLK